MKLKNYLLQREGCYLSNGTPFIRVFKQTRPVIMNIVTACLFQLQFMRVPLKHVKEADLSPGYDNPHWYCTQNNRLLLVSSFRTHQSLELFPLESFTSNHSELNLVFLGIFANMHKFCSKSVTYTKIQSTYIWSTVGSFSK